MCLVVQSYYSRDPRVRREAEALAQAGYEVDVIGLKGQGSKWRENVGGVNVLGLPIARRRATVLRYMLEYSAFFFLVTAILTFRLIRGRRYHLIHVNNMPDFLVFSTLFPKLFGAKVLLDVHDPMAEVFMSKYGMKSSNIIIKLLRWQERISLRYCDHALTVSGVMKERLQSAAGYTPISVVLNMPDETVFRRPDEDMSRQKSADTFVLLYTGTISARYGLDLAIEAVARLKDKIPGLKLRLVGEGDDLPALRRMVNEMELNDIVEFHPAVPLPEIPELIAESDVGISPHVNDVFMSLYFSNKVAEFVILGLPTVVTRTRTIEQYFDESMVRFCEADDVDSFARAVYELYANPEVRAEMSRNCREFGKRWSWSVEKEEYLRVVARLVGVSYPGLPEPKARVLILVENLPVPFDRRVWAESLALTEAGYKVSVICPAAPGEPLYDCLNDITIYRYPAPSEGGGRLGYLWEFAYAMTASFRLALKVRKCEGFDVMQACNPPDTFFVLGRYFRMFHKVPFIFDHHDLSPELYAIRFGKSSSSLVYRVLAWLERCTFNAADVVMSVNESVKELAVVRGRKDPAKVFVVRNAPDLSRFKPMPPNPEFRMGREHLVCYVGVMAAQDGLDYLLHAIHHVVHNRKRTDITFTLIGSGEKIDELKKLAKELKIDDYTVFTGRIRNDPLLATYLSTADVCVAPDPKNELNDKCSLIKITEYMAMGKPIVAFELRESRLTAQDAAIYATPNDTAEFGDRIVELIDDAPRREFMGAIGKERIRNALSWAHSKQHLLAAYEAALGERNLNRKQIPTEDVA